MMTALIPPTPPPGAPGLADRDCAWCRRHGPARLFCRYGRTLPVVFTCRDPGGCLDRRNALGLSAAGATMARARPAAA